MTGLTWLISPFTDLNHKRSSHGDTYYELDGLRGIAVFIVLLSHTASFGMFGQGSLGVLMFFFLSGFVLSLPYQENPKKIFKKKHIFRFFINRTLRIIPAYYVAILIIFSITTVKLDWVLWNASFIKGWNHFWSVAQEARFYLLFPFVIAFISFFKSQAVRLLILISLIAFFYEYRTAHKIDMLDQRHVSFYFWIFLGGVLTCQLHQWDKLIHLFKKPYVKLFLLSLSFLTLFLLIFSSSHYMNTLWKPLFPFIPTGFQMNGWKLPILWFWLFLGLFLSATIYKRSFLHTFLSNWFFRHIGLLSYSIYLYHMNIMFILIQKGYTHEKLFFLVLICSYVAAYISYILIEKPALKLKHVFN